MKAIENQKKAKGLFKAKYDGDFLMLDHRWSMLDQMIENGEIGQGGMVDGMRGGIKSYWIKS